jgi:hypothetical protein
MTATMLTDGRRVPVMDECKEFSHAIGAWGDPLVPQMNKRGGWYLECACCHGNGEHYWSPSGHGVDPNGGEYACEPCGGLGEFKVATP